LLEWGRRYQFEEQSREGDINDKEIHPLQAGLGQFLQLAAEEPQKDQPEEGQGQSEDGRQGADPVAMARCDPN
jgi:hypothetical protein